MATLQTMAFSSPVSHCCKKPQFLPGMISGVVCHSSRSAFTGQALSIPISRQNPNRLNNCRTFTLTIQMVKPSIQFIPGKDEQTIPDVKLTKSRDGTNGTLQSVDVSAKFVNGRPAGIEAKYVMRTPRDWDRFMRFMERYANVNGLQFIKS
ncbi:unnamed protein product [Lactuca virosa]|uniref:Photosystem II reaction center Psb28 protein n=1 Tax=Lactuca virosa TaxID=75947 RepID=A0AAU9LWY2_9ASTR|nr:unnamed protein product [Lactuca virosa]